jgi:hypothetical protein
VPSASSGVPVPAAALAVRVSATAGTGVDVSAADATGGGEQGQLFFELHATAMGANWRAGRGDEEFRHFVALDTFVFVKRHGRV